MNIAIVEKYIITISWASSTHFSNETLRELRQKIHNKQVDMKSREIMAANNLHDFPKGGQQEILVNWKILYKFFF